EDERLLPGRLMVGHVRTVEVDLPGGHRGGHGRADEPTGSDLEAHGTWDSEALVELLDHRAVFRTALVASLVVVDRGPASKITRAPSCLVRSVPAHLPRTIARLCAAGRKPRWMPAHTHQAGKPASRTLPDSRIAKLRPMTARFPLSK